MRSLIVYTLTILPWVFSAVTQSSGAPTPYDDPEAYHVYSALLPSEESFEFAKAALVIQQQTFPAQLSQTCMTDEARAKFKDAIADFARVNRKVWLLQRQLDSSKPYQLVGKKTIDLIFKTHPSDGWKYFYEHYPASGGIITVSAVGFSRDQSLAVVYSGSFCGSLCGRWGFHLLGKSNGAWKQVPGITCIAVS